MAWPYTVSSEYQPTLQARRGCLGRVGLEGVTGETSTRVADPSGVILGIRMGFVWKYIFRSYRLFFCIFGMTEGFLIIKKYNILYHWGRDIIGGMMYLVICMILYIL